MSACAAARDLARAPLEKSEFDQAGDSTYTSPNCEWNDRSSQFRRALRQAGLTMSQVSASTGARYGKNTPYFIPPTFLYKQKSGITPHVCQIVALSEVIGYRFSDCMNLCGFDLKQILGLQLEVHTERTAIVTPPHNLSAWDPSFMPRNSNLQESNRRYLYAKVGSRDNVAYPKLLPGSVVRADRCYLPRIRNTTHPDDLLWLVEHPGGLTCCHVKRIDSDHIVLLPNRPPLSAWPLHVSREARILGLINLELRPCDAQQVETSYLTLKPDHLATLPQRGNRLSISGLLRASRSRIGLTLRAAHKMTLRVAELVRNRDYGIPLGLLSDYEATDRFPRHIAKIISLCVIYGIDFWELMEAGGNRINDSDKAPLFPIGN